MTEDFPWGEVVKLHNIEGLPAIVEYKVGPEFENTGKVEFHVTDLNCSLGAYMRELVISRLRDSSWYSNLFDECEGSPPLLETYTDTQLLDLYVQHC